MTLDAILAKARLLSRDRHYEDFEVGRSIRHRLSRTLLESDNSSFTTLTLSYNPLYLDLAAARSEGHPSIVINPLLVFLLVFGISVEDLSEGGGPFLGADDLEFLEPVYAGATVTASSVVLDMRESDSRPGWGIVTWRTEGFVDGERKVLSFSRNNLMPKAGAQI